MHFKIKICCISSLAEARMAIAAGVDALGLVGKMPSGPGPIKDEMIAHIAMHIPPPISSFLLTSEQTATAIIDHVKRVHTNTVQIVDEPAEGAYYEIKKALPYLRIVQVIHVGGEESIAEALAIQQQADAILLDSGNPKAAIKTLGGTGNKHNWEISREIVRSVSIPVFLAGGLTAENVADAINMVHPYGIDACSGVRTDGKLDKEKLKKFVAAVRHFNL